MPLITELARYNYDGENHRLIFRMPSAVHALFIARVKDAIFSQLKSIRKGLDDVVAFAQKLYSARSTEIYFPIEDKPAATKSKHGLDVPF